MELYNLMIDVCIYSFVKSDKKRAVVKTAARGDYSAFLLKPSPSIFGPALMATQGPIGPIR